jgi:hypothetical protein
MKNKEFHDENYVIEFPLFEIIEKSMILQSKKID